MYAENRKAPKILRAIPVASLAFVLSSCAVHPGYTSKLVIFEYSDSFLALNGSFSGGIRLVFRVNISTENQNSIKIGKLFIGDKTFSENLKTSTNQTFSWYIDKPCQDLPKGDNISIRYELYDASGAILQKTDAPVITKISTC